MHVLTASGSWRHIAALPERFLDWKATGFSMPAPADAKAAA